MDTNTYEIILTDVAKEELENTYEYISEHLQATNAANRLMDKIEQNIFMLETNSYLCSEVQIKPHNDVYRKLVVENYIVLYEIEEQYKQVVIHRVIYGGIDYLKIEDE